MVTVSVGQARAVARRWVTEEASRLPGFAGAFFHGSVLGLPDEAPLPPASDVDVMVVLADPNPPEKLGKLEYRGVLIEASYLPLDHLQSPEQILGQYHLAGSFRAQSVILDPTGTLIPLQLAVARDFAKRRWVERRCEHALDKIASGSWLDPADPFHDQVVGWLFPTGITTHVVLVAGLRNPTVRTRFLTARALLTDYHHLDFYNTLLDLLGCTTMTRQQAVGHLAVLTVAFDAAKEIIKTPLFFASDISEVGRPIAIDGSQELIERGDHREAIFWMVATSCRCQKVFFHDAPAATYERFDAGFRALLADLGIMSFADLQRRTDELRRFLPELRAEAAAIMAANPDVED